MIYGSRVCTSKIIVVLPILGFAYWVSTCAGRVWDDLIWKLMAGFQINSVLPIPKPTSLPSHAVQAGMPSSKKGGWVDVQALLNARHPGHDWPFNSHVNDSQVGQNLAIFGIPNTWYSELQHFEVVLKGNSTGLGTMPLMSNPIASLQHVQAPKDRALLECMLLMSNSTSFIPKPLVTSGLLMCSWP